MPRRYLVFESGGYHFGLPMEVVDTLQTRLSENQASFSSLFFGVTETELFAVRLLNGALLGIHEFYDIISPVVAPLPLPGYIFKRSMTTLQGVFWDHDPKIFLLSGDFLSGII